MKKNTSQKTLKKSTHQGYWPLVVFVGMAILVLLRWERIHNTTLQSSQTTSQDTWKTESIYPENTDVQHQASSFFDSISFTYDTSKYMIEKSTAGTLKDRKVVHYPAWSILNKDGSQAARVVDLSSFDINTFSYQRALNVSDEVQESELRDVTVTGKKYTFLADVSGEGGPTINGCSEGGSAATNYFMLPEKKLAVMITTTTSEEHCEGQEPKIVNEPDARTLEEILQVVESMSFEKK